MKNPGRYVALLFACILLCLSVFGQPNKTCHALFPISNVNKQWGYMDCTGNVVIEPQFLGSERFSDGVGVIHSTKGDGFVDLSGKIKIFEGVEILHAGFSEGLAYGKVKRDLGFIDKIGNLSVKISEHGELLGFREGVGAIVKDGKYFYVDKQGRVLVAQGFDDANGFREGVATVVINGKWAVIDRSGSYVLPPQDEPVSQLSDGLINARRGNRWLYSDKRGKPVLKVEFEYAGDFVEGLARVLVNGKWGFIDKTGKIVIPPQFEEAQDFSEGLAAVNVDEKLAFIDASGRIVISNEFEYLPVDTRFHDGLAYVYGPKVEGYIDKGGKWIWSRPRP